MRLAWLILLAAPLLAQEKKEEEKKPEPPPPAEKELSGTVEVGYRSLLTQSGNVEAYRSIVNLGEGPKLFNADLRLVPKKANKAFDEASLLMRNWGGEPYSTLRGEVSKANVYHLLIDYRNYAHYNFLPSFANPLLGTGSLLNQNAFDTRLRSTDVRLDLFPSSRISPFFAYSRNSEQGGGVWLFSRQGNEYAVPTLLDSASDHYLGGLSLRFGRVNASVEQGGTKFRDDQASDENLANRGNLTRPYLGRNLRLTDLNEQYRVRGDSVYSRGSVAINPASWVNLAGSFIYTNPNVDVSYENRSQGTFVIPQTLLDASGGLDRFRGTAKMPRPSGSLRGELRPWRRLRIVEAWNTERFHNSATGQLLAQYLTGTVTSSLSTTSIDRLVTNDSRQQIDAFFDVTGALTLHGGHRYQWGDATVRASNLASAPFEAGKLSRQIGVAGIAYRMAGVLRMNADFEAASTSRAYFRTSLRDYRKLRGRASFSPKPTSSWRAAFDYQWLDNDNPDPTVRWDFQSRAATTSLEYSPNSGKRYSILGDYTRSTMHSRINILVPSTLLREFSNFREAGNSGTLLVRIQPYFSFGGTLYVNNGSRPTRYYLPQARFSLPLSKQVSANAEWRWFSFGESLYRFESFGSHQLLLSLTMRR